MKNKSLFVLIPIILLLVIPIKAENTDFSQLKDIIECRKGNYDNCINYFFEEDKFEPGQIWICGFGGTTDKIEECMQKFAEKGGSISLCSIIEQKACIETYGKDTGDFAYCDSLDPSQQCSSTLQLCVKTYALKARIESDCELILNYCKIPNWQPGSRDYTLYKECKKEFIELAPEEKECYEQKDSAGCLTKLAIKENNINICYKIINVLNQQDYCLFEVAKSLNDVKVCDKIKTNLEPTNYRDECYSHFFHLTKDSSLCAKIENELWKETCYETSRPSTELITTAPNIALRYFLFFVVITSLTVFGILITRKSYYFKGITYGLIFGYIVVILFGILKFDPRNISSTFIRYLFFTLENLPFMALIYGSFGLLAVPLMFVGALEMISPAIAYIVNSGVIYLLGYSLIGLIFGLLYRLLEKYVNKKFAVFAILVLIIFFWLLFALNPHLLQISFG